MPRLVHAPLAALLVAGALAVGCTSTETLVETTVSTLPIGELPSSIAPPDASSGSEVLLGPSSTLSRDDQVGSIVSGNRLIVIGD